jgi:hypothetical protein
LSGNAERGEYSNHFVLRNQAAGADRELSLSGNELVSGTSNLSVSAAGRLVVNGRQQTTLNIDLRGGNAEVMSTAVILASGTAHILGGTLKMDGFIGSRDKVVLNAVDDMIVTGVAQSGLRLNVSAGVSSNWTFAALTSNTIARGQLTGGNIRVERSGVLDATQEIRVVAGEVLIFPRMLL